MKKNLAVSSIGLVALLSGCTLAPKTFTAAELSAAADERLVSYTADQESITEAISLYEAMARAIKYNLDYKVEMMEEALRSRELRQARFDLLPEIVANAGYTSRDNFSGASSSRLLGDRIVGDQSLVASTSSERRVKTSDIGVSWDILDFGLSYVRAQQQSDEILIAEERRRKVVIRIIEDVRTAYWRAISAERLVSELASLEADINNALSSSMRAYERRNTPPLTALTYQRELLKIKEEIQKLEGELVVAKQQLAALMNLDPSEVFELVMPSRDAAVIDFDQGVDDMVMAALLNRPELREIGYRQRINEKEAKAALLDLLPSLRAYGGFNYDSNDFLFNNHWAGWGARASWNLIETFRYPVRKRTIAAQQDLLDQRALALTMAVVTQVHVSRTRYELAKRKVDTMRTYHDVQSKILDQIKSGFNVNRVSRQTHIREKMNKIVADAKYDIALADFQNAFANIHAAMGLDPYPADVSGNETVAELTEKLRAHWSQSGMSLSSINDEQHMSQKNLKTEDRDVVAELLVLQTTDTTNR